MQFAQIKSTTPAPHAANRGSVLVVTLVVIALLTLGAAAYFERMFSEHRATRASGRQLQSRQLAESGVEYVKAMLMQDPATISQSGGLYANPNLFQAQLVSDDPIDAFRGRFSIVAPDITTDGLYGGLRYGLENESARLNMNTILVADAGGAQQGGARKLLMTLPGMTESIADAILDWIDSDDQPREFGAESDYYSSLATGYAPRNGPLGSLEELLLVRDVTPALLFGADLNRNTMIDGIEQPLTTIDNTDNSTGLLNRGWAAYLTLDSAETNLRPDGKPKIDINQDDLEALHKELSEVLGADMANFIVAYRQGGAYEETEGTGEQAGGIQLDFTQPGRERFNTVLDLIGVRTRIAKPTQSGGSGSSSGESDSRGGESSGREDSRGDDGDSGRGEEGGNGGDGENDNSRIIVEAAFPEDGMNSYISKIMDNLTVNPDPAIPGRLNINQAPRQLLTGIPNLPPGAVDMIISNRDVTIGQQRPEQAYETWLLTDGIVDLPTMKKLMSMVTTGGAVYRAQVVGFFDADGPADRLEVVVDATKTPPVVRRRWELRDLGPGYSLEILGAQPTNNAP